MKHSLLIICMLILIVIVCGCTITNSNTQKDVLPKDKYVAVYEEYSNNSTLIGNTPNKPDNPMPIPMPIIPFDYNNSSGTLVFTNFINSSSVNDSFKVLYGKNTYIYTPTAYGWEGVFSKCVYDLPYTNDEGFTIINISRNGTIYALYNNESIVLKPGDTWASKITTGTAMGHYAVWNNPQNNTFYDWPIKYNTSFSITNYGIYNKSLWNSSYVNK